MIILIAGATHTGKTLLSQRLDDSDLSKEDLIRENEENLRLCKENGCNYILIEDTYQIFLADVVN